MGARQLACGHCGQEADMTCTSCKVTTYCCREHQKEDWRLHKLLCKPYADFQDQDRPSQAHRVAILLPERKVKPRFIWLNTLSAEEKEGETEEADDAQGNDEEATQDQSKATALPNFEDLLGEGTVHIHTTMLLLGESGSGLGANLDHGVYMATRATNMHDGSQPNKCIASCTNNRLALRFRGPIVLYGMATAVNDRRAVDLGTVDLSLVMKRLEQHHELYLGVSPPIETLGVMVYNPSLAAAKGVNPFSEIYVPFEHEVFKYGETSEISKLINMPLLTFEHVADKTEAKWEDDDEDEWQTSPASFLHLNVNSDKTSANGTSFGTISAEWYGRNGSVLVVRQDKQPLTAHEVETLCKFSALESKRLLMKASESFDSRRDAVANISEGSWKEFMAEHKLDGGGADGEVKEEGK